MLRLPHLTPLGSPRSIASPGVIRIWNFAVYSILSLMVKVYDASSLTSVFSLSYQPSNSYPLSGVAVMVISCPLPIIALVPSSFSMETLPPPAAETVRLNPSNTGRTTQPLMRGSA